MKIMVSGAAVTLFLAAASYSHAADMAPVEPPAEAPITEVSGLYDWNGFYIGANVGYGWTNGEFDDGIIGFDRNFNGALLGAHAGYNYQNGNWVFGGEVDVKHDFNEDSFTAGGTDFEAETKWGGSIRARLGYAIDRTLIYGTGGYAFTRAHINNETLDESASETFHGWTVGAGVEHAFTDNLLGRVEYRYTDYGDKEVFDTGGNVDLNTNSVTVGLSWKF
ncbi:MAG: porin family protein [Shinella sp.]|nr:porin family protein [Shinella sp.]